MRNLFANLIDEEIRRDEVYRKALMTTIQRSDGLHRGNASLSIVIPRSDAFSDDTEVTPRPPNGDQPPLLTPGLSIGVATPGFASHHLVSSPSQLPSTSEADGSLERDDSTNSQASNTATGGEEYFSPSTTTQPSEASSESEPKVPFEPKVPLTPTEKGPDTVPSSPVDEKDEKKKGSLFGMKFQMNFQNMKLGRAASDNKPVVAAPVTKVDEAESDKSSGKEEISFENSFLGVVQRTRHDYEEQLRMNPDQSLTIGITPCPLDEAPDLSPPTQTLVLVQEDDPESGGVVDLYRGTVGELAQETDMIERVAPSWLGELLLRVSRYGHFIIPETPIMALISLFLS